MRAAIGDAAFMTQMEKNSDIVVMNCYAPMLVNVNPGARQWRPNLVGYDRLRVYGSPSYHAIKMFSTHIGDEILKSTATDTDVLVSATRDSRAGTIYQTGERRRAKPRSRSTHRGRGCAYDGTALTLAADPKPPMRSMPRTRSRQCPRRCQGSSRASPTSFRRTASSC